MRLVRSFVDAAAFAGAAVSIGNFDGVHRGHQTMLRTLVSHAKSRGVPSLVMTFEPHPIALLKPELAPPSLSTLERKAELIAACGVDCLLGYPTARGLLDLTADEFFDRIIRDHLQAAGLVEGPNFRFGKARGGDVDLLARLCEREGMFLEVLEPVADDLEGDGGGTMISSSRIRAAIADGRVAEAAGMLGHAYQIAGTVVRGDGRGREIGYPTANLDGVATLLPAAGVYAGRALLEGVSHAAAINIGGNPTFGVESVKVEAHLIGFDGDLYGRPLRVDLLRRLRGVQPFAGRDELVAQLAADVAAARAIVAETSSSPPR